MSQVFKCDRCGKEIAEDRYVLDMRHQPNPTFTRVGKSVCECDLCKECYEAIDRLVKGGVAGEGKIERRKLFVDGAEFFGYETDSSFSSTGCWSEDIKLRFGSGSKNYAVEVVELEEERHG
ncbi:MAG: hypothetical protein IKF14_13485 [Atopobiaceae bacterium]|nr:hypothetical protein [Atopobiaceae bacterium]